MITTDGKIHIKRFLAGQVPAVALSIAFGIGDKAEEVGDTSLQFEVGRSDILLTSYDFDTDELIFKAPLPDVFGGEVYEVALYSMAANAEAGAFGSRLVASFDSATETWVDSSTGLMDIYTNANTRLGLNSLNQSPAASATKTSSLRNRFLDFSGNSGADKFTFAFNVNNDFANNVKFRFLNDAGNYFEFALGAQTTGYKFVSRDKASATVVGNPNWEFINELQVVTTSGAGGESNIDFDGIRIEDVDTINPNYTMVSRELLTTPFVKEDEMVQDIEFALVVAV